MTILLAMNVDDLVAFIPLGTTALINVVLISVSDSNWKMSNIHVP